MSLQIIIVDLRDLEKLFEQCIVRLQNFGVSHFLSVEPLTNLELSECNQIDKDFRV
jgi:hypothetical protein